MKAILGVVALLSAGPTSAAILFERSGALEYGGSGAYTGIAIDELSLDPGRYAFEITLDAAAPNLLAEFSSTGFYYFYENNELLNAGPLLFDSFVEKPTPVSYLRVDYRIAGATSVTDGQFRTDYDQHKFRGASFTIVGCDPVFEPCGASTYTLKVSSVPEPGSWAMMIAGFGLSGAALRHPARRRYQLGHTG